MMVALSDLPPPGPGTFAQTVVGAYLPEGTVLTPSADRFEQDPDLLVHFGKHPDTTPEQRERVKEVVRRWKPAFAYKLSDLGGYSGGVGPMVIHPLSDKRAFCKPKTLSPLKKEIELRKNTELLECGMIEPAPHATSAANPSFAEKRAPDGTYTDIRLCYNYRPQNQLTADQHTSYPVAEELFRDIGDSKFFSKLDLRSGFLQIPVHEDTKDLTAFWWAKNLYRFTRMPFGLKQAPATFQRVVESELGRAGLLGCAKVFIDDVLVHSDSFEEHLGHVERVLRCLWECGLRAHPEKSSFCIDTIDFLGFDVSRYGLTPQEAKVKALMALPHPSNLTELRTVLGKLRYYGGFCTDFSARAQPLFKLLQKDQQWEWDSAVQGAAFEEIRGEIAKEGKALRRFDPARPIFVHSDFSNRGLGGVLGQVDEKAREYMVACISRTLNKAERNYSSYKGECLAAVWACRTFRPYIHGLKFTLVTDHKPLQWLMTSGDLEGAMARWACILQEFDLVIMHRAGEAHQNADALSRFPLNQSLDQSGARLDHDSCAALVLAAVLLKDPEYRTLHGLITKGAAGPEGVATVEALDTHAQNQAWGRAVTEGVTLYEPCGGICAGLEAVLRNGITVRRYIYSDISQVAQTAAAFRIAQMQERYPQLLKGGAVADAFTTLPMDVVACGPSQLVAAGARDGTQWLVIAGPECKDFSPAGHGRGRAGRHAHTLQGCISIIGSLQQLQPSKPPLYILENAAMQNNFNSQRVREEDFPALCRIIGTPVVLDAARFGAFAHRLRDFWQNAVEPGALQRAVEAVQRAPGILVDSIMDPGRHSSPVLQPDRPPFYPANQQGGQRSAFPTFTAYPLSRAFRAGQAGSVYDSAVGGWTEPNPSERERALGYSTGTTAAPGLSLEDRHVLTGNCIDQSALTGLIRAMLVLSVSPSARERLAYCPVHAQPGPDAGGEWALPVLPALGLRGEAAALHLALAADAVAQAVEAGEEDLEDIGGEPEGGGPEETLANNRRLARQAAEPDGGDIYEDAPVLAFLRSRELPAGRKGPAPLRRVLRRAMRYHLSEDTGDKGVLYRIMRDGSRREVPPPDLRPSLVAQAHALGGHFGSRRTQHLLLSRYWWQGMQKDANQLVAACPKCDRVRASFNTPRPTLQPLPIEGLFYRWGVDTSGPFEVSKRGNRYILHAVEHYSGLMEAVPMPSKESSDTAYAFSVAVISRYGGSAQVLTDNGGEYRGEFQTLLEQCGIDHRTTSSNHPQSNGLAERAVQTVKRALRKHCEAVMAVDTWDLQLPWVMLAYNCSKQASTKLAPYHLLYAREPVFPSGQVAAHMQQVLPDPSRPKGEGELVAELAVRAQYIREVTPVLANNLAIAQHRDTLRYAHIRSGSYKAQTWSPAVGSFVYVKRPNQDNTLQITARTLIVKVVEARPTGVVIVQGKCGNTAPHHVANLAPCHLSHIDGRVDPSLARPSADLGCEVCRQVQDDGRMMVCDVCGTGWHMYCLQPPLAAVPQGDWICPSCTRQGIEEVPPDMPRSEALEADEESLADKLFVPTASRALDEEAKRLGGRSFHADMLCPDGTVQRLTGTVRYRGAQYRPHSLEVHYSNGAVEHLTARQVKQHLSGAGAMSASKAKRKKGGKRGA